jgi:hypothetical protein
MPFFQKNQLSTHAVPVISCVKQQHAIPLSHNVAVNLLSHFSDLSSRASNRAQDASRQRNAPRPTPQANQRKHKHFRQRRLVAVMTNHTQTNNGMRSKYERLPITFWSLGFMTKLMICIRFNQDPMGEMKSVSASIIQATRDTNTTCETRQGKKRNKLWSYHKAVFTSPMVQSPIYIVSTNGHTEMAEQGN